MKRVTHIETVSLQRTNNSILLFDGFDCLLLWCGFRFGLRFVGIGGSGLTKFGGAGRAEQPTGSESIRCRVLQGADYQRTVQQ